MENPPGIEALQEEAKAIMKTEAYQTKDHPGHKEALRRVKVIYKRLYPENQGED
jgi:hypothetical protein